MRVDRGPVKLQHQGYYRIGIVGSMDERSANIDRLGLEHAESNAPTYTVTSLQHQMRNPMLC